MPDSRERIIETLRERAVDPGMGWLNQAADLLTADAVEGDREATCALCGHEWRRHDPEDGQCDAHTAEPGEYGPCQCGRDLAWMQRRIAGLSRAALGSGSRLPEPDQAGGLNPEAAKRYGCKKCGASLGQAHRRDCATGLGLAEECEHCTPVPTMGVVPASNRWYFGGFVDDQNLRHDPMRHDPDCPMRQEPPKA